MNLISRQLYSDNNDMIPEEDKQQEVNNEILLNVPSGSGNNELPKISNFLI